MSESLRNLKHIINIDFSLYCIFIYVLRQFRKMNKIKANKINLAIISPFNYLEHSLKGDIHMALTHLVLNEDNLEYVQFYRQSNKYKILDNSAFELEELGVGLKSNLVLKAADIISADEIIATDVLYKAEETIESTINFINDVKNKNKHSDYKIQAVAQGSSKKEILYCFHELMKMNSVNVIGLSKLGIPASYKDHIMEGDVMRSRISFINTIINSKKYKLINSQLQFKDYSPKSLHLLGSDNRGFQELWYYRNIPFIRSMDTSMPIWYALNGKYISESENFIPELFKEKVDFKYTEENKKLSSKRIKNNLEKLMKNSWR